MEAFIPCETTDCLIGNLCKLLTALRNIAVVDPNTDKCSQRILDTHYKSGIVMFSFGITIIGWWLWQVFLAGSYSPGVWPYAVRGGFFSSFGDDPLWWVTLVAVLGLLVSLELAYNSVKRNLIISGLWKWGWKWLELSTWKRAFGPASGPVWSGDGARGSLEDWDVELWQAMEKDPSIKETLRQMSKLGYEETGQLDGMETPRGSTDF
jgi:phospholipid-translocating ATPase